MFLILIDLQSLNSLHNIWLKKVIQCKLKLIGMYIISYIKKEE